MNLRQARIFTVRVAPRPPPATPPPEFFRAPRLRGFLGLYLSWAFVEASNFARRHDENCRQWADRKAAKTSPVIATKALACKLSKAGWHVMAGPADYDPKRMFPELAMKTT